MPHDPSSYEKFESPRCPMCGYANIDTPLVMEEVVIKYLDLGMYYRSDKTEDLYSHRCKRCNANWLMGRSYGC